METQTLQVSTEQILAAMTRMSLPELEQVHASVIRLQAERKAPHLSEQETALLMIINQGLPASLRARRSVLQAKRQHSTITDEEYQELTDLTLKAEELHAERLAAVAELARIRGVSLPLMLNQLGLHFPENA